MINYPEQFGPSAWQNGSFLLCWRFNRSAAEISLVTFLHTVPENVCNGETGDAQFCQGILQLGESGLIGDDGDLCHLGARRLMMLHGNSCREWYTAGGGSLCRRYGGTAGSSGGRCR